MIHEISCHISDSEHEIIQPLIYSLTYSCAINLISKPIYIGVYLMQTSADLVNHLNSTLVATH